MLNLPTVSSFDAETGGEQSGLGPKWDKWILRFENYIAALAITNEAQKRALLLHSVGQVTFEKFQTLAGTGDDYKTAKDKLTDYFKPRVNKEYERALFRRLRQNKDETIDSYHTRLRQACSTCGFEDTDGEIKSHIIQTTTDSKLRKVGLRDDQKTLNDILDLGRNNELCQAQNMDMERQLDSRGVIKDVNMISRGRNQNKGQPRSHTGNQPRGHRPGHQQSTQCRNCGEQYPHAGGRSSCPAFGKPCRGCGKLNHFARVCQSSTPSQRSDHPSQMSGRTPRGRGRGRGRGWGRNQHTINELSNETFSVPTEDSDYLFTVEVNDHDSEIKHGVNKLINKLPKFRVEINDCEVICTADSAASCNIVDEHTYNYVLKDVVKLEPITSTEHINAYGGTELVPIGKFTADISIGNVCISGLFYVMPENYGCLLSVTTSVKLGLITISDHVLSNIGITASKNLLTKNPQLFDGIGCMKDYKVKFHIDPSIAPVAQRHRRIPFHLRKMVEAELERLENLDIIEHVDGPTPWVSPLVAAPKPKNPKEIRLCVDMRRPNKAIIRERHPAPTLDDIQNRVNGASVFSKLDLRSGYHQLLLDEDSRYITTFSTHVGLRRYKRLNFGISCASEIFQNAIEHVIDGIAGAMNMSDDIIIFGKDQESHDKALEQVFQRLSDNNLTLNGDKCEFNKHKIGFYGMIFSSKGMQPDPRKVDAIVQMSVPASSEEVQSLLGMTNFLSRFIPHYSTITEPLRRLTHQGIQFVWGKDQSDAFEKLKMALTCEPIISYFDKDRATELIVDASPVGLGAILAQRDSEGGTNVVAYGSRSLTPTEQRYAQVEREALAVVWALEHFYIYVFGGPIRVVTDHQPLLGIYSNPTKKLSPRLERWALRVQPFDIEIVYRRGAENPADYLSRHPKESYASVNVADEYINFVASHAVPKAITRQEIVDASIQDPTLTVVKELIRSRHWHLDKTPDNDEVDQHALQSFRNVSDELATAEDGIILRGSRIVIPSSLQQRVINIAHEGHQGINRTKSLLREKVWFPGIDRMAAETIKACIACQATFDSKPREPLQMSPLPDQPWSQLCADFYGPLPSGHYLLAVLDEYSRFPEVEIVTSLSAATIIPVLDKLFASRGLPNTLKTDNGTPFQSESFKVYCENMGIKHKKITPYWPEANGCAERFMRTMGKVCRAAQVEAKPWKQELFKFLRNYRATPHSSTGQPPATLLNGYSMRTKLPEAHPELLSGHDQLAETDRRAKAKMKFYAERRRNIAPSDFKQGDKVLMKNITNPGKMKPKFQQEPFQVVDKKGSMILAQRGREVKARNSSFFKRVHTPEEPLLHWEEPDDLEPQNVETDESETPYRHPEQADKNVTTNAEREHVTMSETPQVKRPQRVVKIPPRFRDFEVSLPKSLTK